MVRNPWHACQRGAGSILTGLLMLGLLAGCGSGGSGGGSSGTPPGTPPPVSANLAPEIISAPVLFASPNTPYTYEAFAVDPNEDAVSYNLATAPPGMTINASSGEIAWTPTSQQSGSHNVQVSASDGRLTGSQSFTVTVETLTTMASATIGSEGGSVTVPQGTSEFAGTSVTIPADQLPSGTTVTLSEVSQPGFAPSTVKALKVSIGSGNSASQTAGLLSKFSLTASAEAALPDPVSTLGCVTTKIYVEILLPELAEFLAPGTKVWVKPATQAAGIPKDWQEITESIQLQKIGNIDAALSKAGGLVVCTVVGEGIEIMVEKAAEKIGGLAAIPGEGWIGTIFQLPRFDVIKGNENEAFWNQPGRRKLLLLHGILSSKGGFDGPDDWNAFVGSLGRYDDVLFYNYPSGFPIAGNGNQLCALIRRMEKRFGTKLENIDIIAHSMGGLVARWLIEKSECRAERLGRTLVKTLVMVGTPNLGIEDVQLSNLLAEYGAKLADFVLLVPPGTFNNNGAQDLLTSSQVIAELNRSVIKKDKVPTRYVVIAGDVGTNNCGLFFEAPGTDCFVPVPTSTLINFLGVRDDQQGADWEILSGEPELYKHGALHTACTKNVVCARILKVLGGRPLRGDSPAPPTTNPPGAPRDVQQSAATSNAEPISTVTLNWIPPQGATDGLAYRILRDGRFVDRVTTTSFKDSGLTPGREYVYTIQAEDQSGSRSAPIEVRVRTPNFVDGTAPNITTVPYHINVTSNSTTIRWFTDEPADSQVEYGLTSALGSTSLLNATRTRSHVVTLTGLTPDATYSYRVKSRDAAGNLATSPIKTFKTARVVGGQPPSPPGSLTVGPASLNFGAVQVGSCSTATFAIQHVLGTGPATGTVSVSPNPPFSIVSGSSFSVSNGSAANVSVRFCPSSAGAVSGTATVLTSATFTGASTVALTGAPTPDTSPPSIPQLLTGTVAGGVVTLSWSPATDDVGVVGYRMFRDGVMIATAQESFYRDVRPLPFTTAYSYTVSAFDAAGNNSPHSGAVAVTVDTLNDWRTQFDHLVAVGRGTDADRIQVYWNKLADARIFGYRLYRNGSRIAVIGDPNVTSYEDTGLLRSVTYFYMLAAYDANGDEFLISNSISAKTLAVSTQFRINDRVETTHDLVVLSNPSIMGSPQGIQSTGAQGVVVAGPRYVDGYWWWGVNYDSGPSGWSQEDGLRFVSTTNPASPIEPLFPVEPDPGVSQSTLTVGPASLNFGAVQVGSCSTASFAIRHELGSDLATGTVSVSPNPPFSIVSGNSFSVSNSSAANVSVRFCPSSAGPVSGTAAVLTTATITGASTVALSGIGTGGGGGAFDFAFSATPALHSVVQGSSISFNATTTLMSGTAQAVTLGFVGCPSGAMCSFNPSSVTPTSGSTFTVSTTSGTPTGASTITLTATSGVLQRQASVQVTITTAGGGGGGVGTLTLTGAPASTGGTFVADSALTLIAAGPTGATGLWRETPLIGNVIHGESVSVNFNPQTGQVLSLFFQNVEGLVSTTWDCSGFAFDFPTKPPCSGVTVSRTAGTLTLANQTLKDTLSSSLITVNGTLTFPPF